MPAVLLVNLLRQELTFHLVRQVGRTNADQKQDAAKQRRALLDVGVAETELTGLQRKSQFVFLLRETNF